VYRELSRLNTEWRLNCGLVNLTGAFGDESRRPGVARRAGHITDMDLSSAGFPYLAVREGGRGRRAGAHDAGRLRRRMGLRNPRTGRIRSGAVGSLMKAGEASGIGPFGVEAQRLLRLEKGHLIVSQDTDGLTTRSRSAWTGRSSWTSPSSPASAACRHRSGSCR
jgi:sarcosine oxidase subunit alpha